MKGKFLIILFLIFLSFSCGPKNQPRITLDSNWQYSTEGINGTYYPIDVKDLSRLSSFVANKKGYIWLKNNFEVPYNMQEQTLSCFLGVTKIADKVYVNNTYIGKSGFFPPNQFTSGELSSAYAISPILLNTDKPNELLITLWVNGKGLFSSIPYIGLENDVFVTKKTKDFLNSNIFLLLSAVLLVISFIYFLLFLFGAGRRSNLSFSRVTFFSAFYLTTVSLGEYSIIFEGRYSFLLFEKIFNGIMAILSSNYAVSFIRDFLNKTDTKRITIFRKFIVFFSIFLVLLGDDLNQFYSILILCYVLIGIHILYGVYLIIKSISEKNNQVVLLLTGFAPVLISLIIGIILAIFHKSNVILTIVVGWQLTILSFLTILVYNFSKTQKDYENLNKNLEKLISERTLELTQSNRKLGEINTKLKYENERTEKEITLATNVQKNFFIHNFKSDDNWEVAYFSEALAGVSGDFYDFYTSNPQKKLDGLGVFDVSGHGLASGLVTMLVKNIINQEFYNGKELKLSEIVSKINDRVLNEKGNIENYLTGILCRINHSEIELVNAGHPYPFYYNKNTNTSEILYNKSENRCGVIGILGLPPKFESITLEMNSDDELIFYTDGITEITNKEKIPFGKNALFNSFQRHINEDLQSQVDLILQDVKDYVGEEKINDDISIIILKKK